MGLLNFLKKLFKRKKKTKRRKKPSRKPSKKKTVKKKAVKKPPKKTKAKQTNKPSKPLKEPKEKQVGVIIHHYGKISVGIIKLKAGLKVGDKIHIKGAHDDFKQVIKSMQLNHQDIPSAKKGDEIGIKVTKPVHENDRVYILPLN